MMVIFRLNMTTVGILFQPLNLKSQLLVFCFSFKNVANVAFLAEFLTYLKYVLNRN